MAGMVPALAKTTGNRYTATAEEDDAMTPDHIDEAARLLAAARSHQPIDELPHSCRLT